MSIETALDTTGRIGLLIRNLDTILPLPEVAMRIITTINDPRSTPAQLHKIISHDPALVSRLLQRVNSSFYTRSGRIDSVERAIVMLGYQSVQNLALSATLGQMFRPVRINEDYAARDLWTHCVAVAATAREIAAQFHKPLAEPAFLAGLLHDIGLLVQVQACPDLLAEVCRRAKHERIPFTQAEFDLIGCNHAELGAAVASKWGFPDLCRSAIAYHHHPALSEPEQRQLVSIIYAADTLCCEDAIGFNLTAMDQFTDEIAGEDLVPPDVIRYVRHNLPQLIADAVVVLGG